MIKIITKEVAGYDDKPMLQIVDVQGMKGKYELPEQYLRGSHIFKIKEGISMVFANNEEREYDFLLTGNLYSKEDFNRRMFTIEENAAKLRKINSLIKDYIEVEEIK